MCEITKILLNQLVLDKLAGWYVFEMFRLMGLFHKPMQLTQEIFAMSESEQQSTHPSPNRTTVN